MDQVTQQNAAMVEETTAAATNLRKEAGELHRSVGQFKTGRDGRRIEVARPSRHAPVRNPVGQAQAKIASFARGGGAAPAATTWEEF